MLRKFMHNSLTLTCVLILLLSILRVAWSAYDWDATYDEYWHLAWSERALLQNNFDREYPNYISTTPVTMLNAGVKQLFQNLGVNDSGLLSKASRLPTVAAYIFLLVLVFMLGRKLLDTRAGLLATTLTAVDANVATHAALTTVDIFFAVITIGFVYQCIRFVERPTPLATVVLAVCTGAAFAVKLSAVLFLPVLLVVILVALSRQGLRPLVWRLPLHLLLGIAVVCLTINTSYKFHEVGFFLRDLRLNSEFMQALQRSLPLLYLPLPQSFLVGFDETLLYERVMQWNTVIFDRYLSDGVWYFFPVTWFFKTPIAVLVLLLMTIAMTMRSLVKSSAKQHWRLARLREWFHARPESLRSGVLIMVLLWLVFFFYFNFVFRTHVGLRYIIMCLPLTYLLASLALSRITRNKQGSRIVMVCLVVAVVEHLPFWNNVLSFSNAFIPDKKSAYHYLTDSNIDWGQNYSRVFAQVNEQYSQAVINPVHILPGDNVIRLNYLAGVFRNFEQHRWVRTHLQPSAHVLHTHLVYQVTAAQFAAFLRDENTADTVPQLSSCRNVVAGLPYEQASRLPEELALCFENPPPALRVRLISGSGTVGADTGGFNQRCEGHRLTSGQFAVFQLPAPLSRLCLASDEVNTRWEMTPFDLPLQ